MNWLKLLMFCRFDKTVYEESKLLLLSGAQNTSENISFMHQLDYWSPKSFYKNQSNVLRIRYVHILWNDFYTTNKSLKQINSQPLRMGTPVYTL